MESGVAREEEVFSERLLALLDDILQGKAPNAGRFCAYCYHPFTQEYQACPHCGHRPGQGPPVTRIPVEVLEMHRTRRSREGLVVRSIAWGGLTLGVVLALLPLAFSGVTWWTVIAFFAILAAFYILSANLANSVGDALGYRWGQSIVRRRWRALVAGRDEGTANIQ